jgi:hypothetical protein
MLDLLAAAWRGPRLLRRRHPDSHAAATRPLLRAEVLSNPCAWAVNCSEAAAVSTPTTGGGSGAEPRAIGGSEESRSNLYSKSNTFLGLARESSNLFVQSLFFAASLLGLMATVGYYGGAPALAAHAVVVQLWMIAR